mmetsp:Transcript_139867/g.243585  ORF Transcript_139867/g.243585 Transcript_139867/m.243585 type:complete len:210 (+) Transcript_139867:810-1439(+)
MTRMKFNILTSWQRCWVLTSHGVTMCCTSHSGNSTQKTPGRCLRANCGRSSEKKDSTLSGLLQESGSRAQSPTPISKHAFLEVEPRDRSRMRRKLMPSNCNRATATYLITGIGNLRVCEQACVASATICLCCCRRFHTAHKRHGDAATHSPRLTRAGLRKLQHLRMVAMIPLWLLERRRGSWKGGNRGKRIMHVASPCDYSASAHCQAP